MNTDSLEKLTCKDYLEIVANIAAILTLIVGFGAWCLYRCRICAKKMALEKYLKKALEDFRHHDADYQFGFLHLTVKTGLSESEILEASFDNKCIHRTEKLDTQNNTIKVLFQYDDGKPIGN